MCVSRICVSIFNLKITCLHWNPCLVTRVGVSQPIQVFRFIVVVQSIPGHYGSIQYTVHSTVQQQYNPSQDIMVLNSTEYTVQYSSSTMHPRTSQFYTEHSTQYSIGVVQCIPGHYSPIQYTVHSTVQQPYNAFQDIIVIYSTQYTIQYNSSTMYPRTLQFYTVHSTVQQQYNASQDIIVLYSTQYSIVVVQSIPGHYSSVQYTVNSTVQQQYNPSQDIIVLYRTQYTIQYNSTIHPRSLQSYKVNSTQQKVQ